MKAQLQARNDSDAAQTDTAKTVTQKRGLADNRPEAVAQRKLAEMMNNSPPVLQQRALSDAIHNSPRMVAQRREINALFGEAVRPQGDGAMSAVASPPQREKINNTGLPNQLKSGIESLSGMSMDHIKVHYNSDKPAQLQAHAYAQGNEIHIGTGQEKHLPHEAWHVVQQAQGRVKSTLQMKGGISINNDIGLEKEADLMGEQALKTQLKSNLPSRSTKASAQIVQRTVWEWSGIFWTAIRTEGQPTQRPAVNGAFPGKRISTGPETDLLAEKNPAAIAVPPPIGYSMVTDSVGRQAYLSDPRGYTPTGVPLDHIVDVAHGNANRIHRSQNMTGHSQPTYVHPNDDELYTFSSQANHTDGFPTITIHEIGKVRGGVHKFQ